MNTGQQPPQSAQSLSGRASGTAPASAASGIVADKTLLVPYVLEPPQWRAPLIANKTPSLYPDFFPGATALYPQPTAQSGVHVPGISRDSLLAGNGPAGAHFVPIAGVTASKEDELSETVAKLGFVNKAVVQTENFSAHALIYNKLNNGPSIHALGKIVQRVLERQKTDDSLLPSPGPWTYKPPSKVVYNASRLETWYTELANPSVPLSKLAKTIPSAPSSSTQGMTATGTGTYTGSTSAATSTASSSNKVLGNAMDRNLDMLITRQVPKDRALWFLQAVGQNEISQLSKSKNLQMHPILTYSGDFTLAFVESLKRQIGEALLPLTQSTGSGRLLPGVTVKGRPRNILAEDHNRERWTNKWNYTLDLLNACLGECMLDRQRLCTLLLQNLQPHFRIHMLWWLNVILHTSIEDILHTAWMSKSLIVAAFEWLSNLGSPMGDDDLSYAECQEIGRGLLLHTWLTDPDMFLLPELWAKASERLRLKQFLGIDDMPNEDRVVWDSLEDRVETLLCLKAPRTDVSNHSASRDYSIKHQNAAQHTSSTWHIDASHMVSLLDGWEGSQSVTCLTESLFGLSSIAAPSGTSSTQSVPDARREVVRLLLMWATTSTRCGRHRPYLAASVLCQHVGLPAFGCVSRPHDISEEGHGHINVDSFEDLQISLMEWIDSQEAYLSKITQDRPQLQCTTRMATLHMCQTLLKRGVLEIGGLVQKVIARGYTDSQGAQGVAEQNIYSLILQEYKGNSQQRALQWQMIRVSLSSRYGEGEKAIAKVRGDCSQVIQPLLQQLSTGASAGRIKMDFTELSVARDHMMSLTVFRRAVLVNDWLVPAIQDALRRNKSRAVDRSTFLSLWWLLDAIDMPDAQVQFSSVILQDFPTSQDLILAIISARELHSRTFMLCEHLSQYATSLLGAFVTLSDKSATPPATRMLSELVELGTLNYLNSSQLQILRTALRKWPPTQSPPPVISSMMSPPDVDRREDDVLRELSACIQTFVQRYNPSLHSREVLEATLTSMTSICGMPINFFGELLPATMHLLCSLKVTQDNQISALCFLASTIASMTTPGDLRKKVGMSRLLPLIMVEVRLQFTPIHVRFLQELIINNATSVQSLIRNVCIPMLVDLAEAPWSDESARNLLVLVSTILLEAPSSDPRSWLLCSARSNLHHQSGAFEIVVDVAGLVSQAHKKACASDASYCEPLVSLYHDLISSSAIQEIVLKQLTKREESYRDIEGDMQRQQVVWDALRQQIDSWSTLSLLPSERSASDDVNRMTAILDAGDFSPLVSPLVRLYCKLLLKGLDNTREVRADEDDGSGESKRWTFASTCLRYILQSCEEEQPEHVRMFAENLGSELYALGLDTLAVEIQPYGASLSNPDTLAAHRDTRLSKLVTMMEHLRDASRGKPPTSRQSLLSIKLLRAVAAAFNSKNDMTRIRSEIGRIEISALARMICFAMPDMQNSLEGLDAIEGCAAALILHLHKGSSKSSYDRNIRDILAWQVHTLGPIKRRRLLEPWQRVLLSRTEDMTSLLDKKVISLGPHPPFAYMTSQDTHFMSLQRTWAGTPASSNAHGENDLKSNNEPLDLLKYLCQTQVIQRHIQPTSRSETSSGWSQFDSEIPFDYSSTFQRDFRRTTITLPDIPQSGQPQNARHRTISQIGTAQAQPARLPDVQASNVVPKQAQAKEKAAEHTGNIKKRKNVPDVIVIDENSPKKKSRFMGNIASTVHATNPAKSQKKK